MAYEAGLWRELRGGKQGGMGGPLQRALKRCANAGARAEIDGDSAHAIPLRKRRKGPLEAEGTCQRQWVRLRSQMMSR